MTGKKISYSQVLLTYPQCTRSKEELLEHVKSFKDIQSAIVCHENHHETDGEHLHAWVKFAIKQRVGAGKWGTLFDWDGKHGDYRKVTCSTRSIADTVKYVMKDGDVAIWNCDAEALMNPGKSHVRKYDNEKILNTPMKQLVDEGVINIKDVDAYKRGIAAYKLLEKPGVKKHCRGIWLYGKAGTGKSTWAKNLGNHLGGYYEKAQNKWWDGYEGEKVVILDDLDTETLLHYIKKWSDKFPCKGEVKGSTVWLHHDWFVVTSNFHLADIVEKTGDFEHFYDAVKRRFHELELPEGVPYFQFDPSCDWSNPEVESYEGSVEPPVSKLSPETPESSSPSEQLE
uniref:ATP-dependent helicase Rep n=1 Tax=CRESS DNA virus TaxID=3138951 RepID=A0AAU8H548_9VIRU